MDLLWIGHAGILIRNGQTLIAIDPFLSGKFSWHLREETYLGDSPWMGDNMDKFLKGYAPRLSAILLTHDHGDHYDHASIEAILKVNPNVEIIAPKVILKKIRRNIVSNMEKGPELVKTRRGVRYSFGNEENSFIAEVLPDRHQPRIRALNKVGYVIYNEDSCVAHVGDAHHVGEWEPFKNRVKDLVLWCVSQRHEIINYFKESSSLKRIWWIHWESFEPGNFSCNMNPTELMKECASDYYEQGVLDYEKWQSI